MEFKCIACRYVISECDPSFKPESPEKGMHRNGTIEKIHMGYGSKLDGNMHLIAICDYCIDKAMSDGVATFEGDYMCDQVKEYKPLKK